MKKLQQLFLCMFFIIVICGCTNNSTVSSSNISQPKEVQEIAEEKVLPHIDNAEVSPAIEVPAEPSDEQSVPIKHKGFDLSSDDFEIIYQNGKSANIETITDGDFIKNNQICYYGYRFNVNDKTLRGIKLGDTVQDVSDAYPDAPIIIGHGVANMLTYNSLNELINSDDMQYAYAFTIFVYSINGAFYSLNESMAMLESEGLPSDSLDPILGLSNIPDVGNVVSYEMTFYLSNKDGEFSIQTPIAFLNIRKAVCAE